MFRKKIRFQRRLTRRETRALGTAGKHKIGLTQQQHLEKLVYRRFEPCLHGKESLPGGEEHQGSKGQAQNGLTQQQHFKQITSTNDNLKK